MAMASAVRLASVWAKHNVDCTTLLGALMWGTAACALLTALTILLSLFAFVMSGLLAGLLAVLSIGGVVTGFVLGGVACATCALTAGVASLAATCWAVNTGTAIVLSMVAAIAPDTHDRLVQLLDELNPWPLARVLIGLDAIIPPPSPRRARPPSVKTRVQAPAPVPPAHTPLDTPPACPVPHSPPSMYDAHVHQDLQSEGPSHQSQAQAAQAVQYHHGPPIQTFPGLGQGQALPQGFQGPADMSQGSSKVSLAGSPTSSATLPGVGVPGVIRDGARSGGKPIPQLQPQMTAVTFIPGTSQGGTVAPGQLTPQPSPSKTAGVQVGSHSTAAAVSAALAGISPGVQSTTVTHQPHTSHSGYMEVWSAGTSAGGANDTLDNGDQRSAMVRPIGRYSSQQLGRRQSDPLAGVGKVHAE